MNSPSNASRSASSEDLEDEYLPDDPVQLVARLKEELRRLSKGSDVTEEGEAASSVSVLLKHAHTLAWRGVAQGDLELPVKILSLLRQFQRFVDLHAPKLSAKSNAAAEIRSALTAFFIAHESLEEVRTKVRLADRARTQAEREVLRVLAESPESYLRRGQVRDRLTTKPSPARVGQVLLQLSSEGLLKSVQSSAQGNPETSYYSLSPLGYDLINTLGLAQLEEEPSVSGKNSPEDQLRTLKVVIATAIDPPLQGEVRRIAQGILQNSGASFPQELRGELIVWIRKHLADPGARQNAHEVSRALRQNPQPSQMPALLEILDAALNSPEEPAGNAEFNKDSSCAAKHDHVKRNPA